MPRIDLDALRAYRQVEPLADAYRKPGCYGSIRHRNHSLRAPEHAADPWPVSRPQRVPDAQPPRSLRLPVYLKLIPWPRRTAVQVSPDLRRR